MRNGIRTLILTFIATISVAAIAGASLQDGLIGYWPLDGISGNVAVDQSGNGHDAKLVGGAAWAPNDGKIGGAIQLDGLGGAVQDENGADYINGLRAFTLSLWVKCAEIPTDRGLIHGIDPSGGDTIFTLRYDSVGFKVGDATSLIKAGITTTTVNEQSYESASDVQTTDWQHLVLTWSSGAQLALYIDSELDTPVFSTGAPDGEITGATKFIIGQGAKDNNGTSWNGLIDDVRLYNRVLSANEITNLASGLLPVEPNEKLTAVWGYLKQEIVR